MSESATRRKGVLNVTYGIGASAGVKLWSGIHGLAVLGQAPDPLDAHNPSRLA